MANPALDSIIAQVQATDEVLASVTLYVKSVPGLIDAAVAKALANGATAAELQPLTQLSIDLKAKSDEAAAAVLANTPATP